MDGRKWDQPFGLLAVDDFGAGAREGCCLNDDFVVLENPLSNELCILLDADIVGMYSLRLIANSQSTLAN